MRKIYSLLLWSVFAYTVSIAQPVNNLVGDIVMPAPNAASLGKYGDVPVSHFTGVPNIGIDIYTIQEGSVSLPVSLSYHASGIRVSETASWVGLGWSLIAGGMITRTVQGLPDESHMGYYNEGDNLTNSQDHLKEVAQNTRDSEPDIFSYNFPGYSGKFYFDGEGVPHFIPRKDLQLIFNSDGGNITQFDGFTIVTPNGIRYVFGKIIRNGSTVIAREETKSAGEPAYKFSSWYLLRVESADRNYAIDLNYVSDNYSYKSPANCKYVKVNCSSPDFSSGSQGTQCPTTGYTGGPFYISTYVKTVKLSSIECSTSTVTFLSNTTRQDLDAGEFSSPYTEALDSIRIESGQFCQKFHLSYNYFKDPRATINQRSESKRLKLVSLQQTSCTPNPSITIPPYTFDYFGTLNTDGSSFFPHLLDKGVDHWGFYNGADGHPIPNSNDTKPDNNNNPVNIPPTVISTPYGSVSHGSSDRKTHEIFVKYASLKKINYPTGGSTNFEFEPHSYPSTSQEQIDLLTNPFTSCPSPEQLNCCDTKTNTSIFINFDSQDEINATQYDLFLDRTTSGCPDFNPEPSVKIEILNSSGTVLGTNIISLSFGEYKDSVIHLSLSTLATLSPSTNYRFRITSFNGYGRFYLYKTQTVPGESLVGGLRIKRVRIEDGISSDNDIIRTYTYKNGALFSKPLYGYFLDAYVLQERPYPLPPILANAQSAVFTPESIIPLSSFQGYHIGYYEVEEIYGDEKTENGFTLHRFTLDTLEYEQIKGLYPLPPLQANVLNGKTTYNQVMNKDSIEVSSMNRGPRTPNSISSTTYMYKISAPLQCTPSMGTPNTNKFFFITPYVIESPTDYQIMSQTETLDGVATTTTYTYDTQNRLLSPLIITTTNSDGKTHTTRHTYPFQYTGVLYDSLVAQNRLMPLQTIQLITDGGTLQTGGTRTNYAFFNTSGQKLSSGSNGFPRPYQFFNYEITWDETNQLVRNEDPTESPNEDGWVLQGTIESYHGNSTSGKGYPKKFTLYGWQPEFYEWENGLIKQRQYEDFIWAYEYYSNSRLLHRITDIDGQDTEFEYDALMRLKTVKERDEHVRTNYTYQFKDANNPRNYVRKKTDYDIAIAFSELRTHDTWQYLDGLGRLIQTVQAQHSSTEKDIVTTQTYDKQGRLSRVYEPFQSNNNTGAYVGAVPDSVQFTLNQYEASPLNRITSVTPPNWYATTSTYGANASGEVAVLTTSGQPGFYGAKSLTKTIVTDPNKNQIITFTDKLGRLILTRRDSVGQSYHNDTYHVYDNKNRPVLIVPPGATPASSNLVYRYIYDYADNITKRYIPGAAPTVMQYDDRNLPTAMQDGNQAAAGRWMVTNYDLYGRPEATGFYTAGGLPTKNAPVINVLLTEAFYDGNDGTTTLPNAKYIGKVRKTRSRILDTNNWLETLLDYDDYGRMTESRGNNHQNLTNFSAEVTTYNAYDWADNLVSITRNHVGFGDSLEVFERTTYDKKGRANIYMIVPDEGAALQVISQQRYTTKDELAWKRLGRKSDATYLQEINYSYNQQGWLTAMNATNNNDLFSMSLHYNTLPAGFSSSLSQKNGNIALQTWSIEGSANANFYTYKYDYLNRLRNANYGLVKGSDVNANNNYTTSYAYDARGNITHLTRNGLYAGTKQQIDKLTYSYYGSGTSNQIQTVTDSAVCPINLEFTAPIEHDGVIQAANSITLKPGVSIDAGQTVNFSVGSCDTNIRYTGGFEQRSTANYEYDNNGNLKKDPNRKVNIFYNHLNLPYLVSWYEDGIPKQIEWLYDATGQRLQKTAKQNGATILQKDYFNGIEYRNDTLEAIYHKEGRVVPQGTGWEYSYRLSDHLGNTRVLFKNDGAGNPEILEELNYYSFGYAWEEGSAKYPFTYNNKRWDNDFGLGLLDFGARFYDPRDRVQFIGIDPIADEFAWVSPYNYAENEPIANIDLHGLQSVPFQQKDADITISAIKNKVKEINDASSRMINAYEDVSGEKAGFLFKAKVYASNYIDEFGGFSDANDAAVLMQGENLDGSQATTTDKVLASVGIFVPVISGSGVKKGFMELISTEPGMQSVSKMDDMASELKNATNQDEFNKIFMGSDGPAQVIANPIDGKTYIIDGHHRLQAAEKAKTGFSVPIQQINLEEQNRFKNYQELIDASNNDF